MKNFGGAANLNEFYINYTKDIAKIYNDGPAICLAGTHGTGKTTCSANILKYACLKGFNCSYTTLSDIVSMLIDASNEEKFLARKELLLSDFLVMDEVDNRFFDTVNSSNLFGATLEGIFRTRVQNKLPTIMCSNSPNPVEGFSGSLKQSIDSLYSNVKIIIAIGNDVRKNK